MEQLTSWARGHGASFEAVPHSQHPRKLCASRDLQPGDVIFSIPERLLLYGARAFNDPEYGAAFRRLQEEAGPELDQRSLLVLLLVLERARGAASFFAPYCTTLPDSYDDPFWWAEADLQLLRGTCLHKAVALYTAGLQQLHSWLVRLEQLQQEQLQQQPQDGGSSSTLSTARGGWGLSAAAVKWARSAVWSRAFSVKGLNIGSNRSQQQQQQQEDALAPVIALVPVLDMCDHHPQQRVSWRTARLSGVQQQQQQQQDEERNEQQAAEGCSQAFQMTSLSPVTQGAELFNNYGSTKSNEELLLGFGFVLDQNPNDNFLVKIRHPTTAQQDSSSSCQEEGEGNGGCDSTAGEAACDQQAVWQQRLAAVAAAGLRLDVPITAAEPLPAKLLDAVLLAQALPAWALTGSSSSSSSGKLLPGVSAAHQQHQQPQQQPGVFEASALQHQLAVLLLLQQLLTAKLQGMLPSDQLQQQLLQQQEHTAAAADTAASSSNPAHARMGAVYALSQQQLLDSALQAATRAVDACLQQEAGSSCASSSSEHAAPVQVEGVQLHPQLHLCSRCGVLSVQAATGAAGVAACSVLLQAPLASCLAGHTEQDLVVRLILAAAAGPQQEQEGERQQQGQQGQHAAPESASGYFARHWQLQQQAGSCSAFGQVLPWWLLPQHQGLVALLQDTPAGQELLQASEELQDRFQALIDTLQAGTAAAAAVDAADSGSNGDGDPQQQQEVLQLIQQQPQEAFRLFCWAQQLVQGGAVELQHGGRQLWLLVPGLEAAPKVLKQLLVTVRISTQDATQVTVTTTAALPAGLQVCRSVTAAGSNAQELLIECGPAALQAVDAAADGGAAGLQHVYELTLAPAADDPLRQQKLQLLSATGLGLCHYLRRPAAHADTTNTVVAAMAVCLLSADEPAQAQLLGPDALKAVEQEQQAWQQTAGLVSAAAGVHAQPTAGPGDAVAAAAAGEATGAARAWAALQEQILQQTGDEARKQLLQVLKDDRKALKAARKQLLQEPSGVGIYLQGQQVVLDAWVEALAGSGGGSGGKKSKAKEGGGGKKSKAKESGSGASKHKKKRAKHG